MTSMATGGSSITPPKTRAFPGNSLTIPRIESNPLLHPARIRIRKSLHARTDRRHFAGKKKPPSGLADGGLSE